MGWLNSVERGREYRAGDLWGSVGAWYAGRWWTDPAKQYIDTAGQTVTSSTGELKLDYGKGVLTLNAPKAQGMSGLLSTIENVSSASFRKSPKME